MSSEIKKEVQDLADKLKKGIKIEKDGTAVPEEGLYEKNLPAGITMDQLKTIQAHNTVFVAAASLATGELSIPVMKKNAEVTQVALSIPTVGKDSIDLTFQRERTIPSPSGEGSTVKYGSLQAKYNMYGVGSRGQLLKVKQELSEKAAAAFGG